MPQPTQELQEAIQLLHAAMAMEPDPEDKAEIATCLQRLTKLQAKNMAQSGQEGGQQQAPPPGAMPDQAAMMAPQGDPREMLLAQLGGLQ